MFGTTAVEPRRSLRLDKHTTGAEDADLGAGGVGLVEDGGIVVMVGQPSPDILKVTRRLFRHMEHERSSNTVFVLRELGAMGQVEVSADAASHAEVLE